METRLIIGESGKMDPFVVVSDLPLTDVAASVGCRFLQHNGKTIFLPKQQEGSDDEDWKKRMEEPDFSARWCWEICEIPFKGRNTLHFF